jgi:hypothetical protein
VPDEARDVVGRMVAEVEALGLVLPRVGRHALEDAAIPRTARARRRRRRGGARSLRRSLGGLRSRLVDWGARSPSRGRRCGRVLGRSDLDDAEALAIALDPARNPYRLETLNVSTHAPLMRALEHAHYTFRKKLSHSADSQDQRHRMVPGSRPLLSRTAPAHVDVVEPELIREDATTRSSRIRQRPGGRASDCSHSISSPARLYLLPLSRCASRIGFAAACPQVDDAAASMRNAKSGTPRWTDRQVRSAPWLMQHVGRPCLVRRSRARCTEAPLLRRARVAQLPRRRAGI